MLFKREHPTNATKQMMIQRRYHRGVCDLLGYDFLSDDYTVIHQDGGMSQHFTYQPPDVETCTDSELDAIAQTWQMALRLLGNGWMVETNVLSQPIVDTPQTVTDPATVAELIQQEREQMMASGRYYQTRYYLSVTWKPNQLIDKRLRRFIWAHEPGQVSRDELILQFKHRVSEFVSLLSRSNQVTALGNGALISFLHQCITGTQQRRVKPYRGGFLNTYLATEDFIGGQIPQMGKQHILCLALDTLPPMSYPSFLDSLSQLPCGYRWSSRFIALDKHNAQAELKRCQRNWSSKAIGLQGVIRESFQLPARIDADAQNMVEQIQQAKVGSSSGEITHGFYNTTLVLMHENIDTLNQLGKTISHHIQQLNLGVRREDANAIESFLGTWPGHGHYNFRKGMVDSQYLSHALPMSGLYQGEQRCPNPLYPPQASALMWTSTEGARPFYFNHFVGDVGHTAILGPTGSGKSTLVAAMIAAHRQYAQSRVIVLDKDASHRTTIKALGGQYFDLASKDCQLAPLAGCSLQHPLSIDRAVNWLSDICQCQQVTMTPARQRLLREAVERLAQEPAHYKTLAYLNVQDNALREAITNFIKGSRGELLGGSDTSLAQLDLMGFDVSELVSQLDQQVLTLPVLKAILQQIEDTFVDKRPTLLILEEAWLYLSQPLFRQKLTDWFKTLRKANVSVIFISQDLSDIVDSGSASIIQNSCLTRIYLANPQAKEPAVKAYYEAFGLNAREVEVLSQMKPKHDYYYSSMQGRRRFQLDLGEKAKAFLCINGKTDLTQFNQLLQTAGADWISQWLAYKGVSA